MEGNKNKASVYFQNGCRYMENKEFHNAISEFDKLISVAPSVDAYKKKYECLTKLGAYKSQKEQKISVAHLSKEGIIAKNLILEKNKEEDKNLVDQNQVLQNIKKVKGKYLGVVNDKLSKKYSEKEIAIACGYFEINNKIKVPLVKEYLEESLKSKEELLKLKSNYSTEDYYLKYIELDIFKGRLCEYDEDHGGKLYVPKRIVENSRDWNYQNADLENFDIEYLENEEGIEDFESNISEKYTEDQIKELDMEKQFLEFYGFSEPMMFTHVSLMNYVDHNLKTNYEEYFENEDIAEAYGIRYKDIHEESFFA